MPTARLGERPGWERTPRVSVSRSVIPITSDLDRRYFGRDDNLDQVGYLDGHTSRFGRTYTGEPDVIARELAQDQAVQAADTVLLTVPNQLGVEYNAHLLRDDRPGRGAGARVDRKWRAPRSRLIPSDHVIGEPRVETQWGTRRARRVVA